MPGIPKSGRFCDSSKIPSGGFYGFHENFMILPANNSQVIGLIAGQGQFPLLFAKAALSLKRTVVLFGIHDITDPSVEEFVSEAHYVGLGELGKVAELIKTKKIRSVALAGAVPKRQLYNPGFKMDSAAQSVIQSTQNRGDDHLLRALQLFLKVRCGASVIDSLKFLKNTMAPRGVLTRRKPSAEESRDLQFGWRIAKGIGKMDIGQTVVVKNRVVLAVEALEGTDAAIQRGADLGQGEVTVVKVCKPNQNLRFDLPSVGTDTLETLKNSRSSVLGVEAGKTIMIFKEQLIEAADRENMTIVGM